jgi:hypothetical protein
MHKTLMPALGAALLATTALQFPGAALADDGKTKVLGLTDRFKVKVGNPPDLSSWNKPTGLSGRVTKRFNPRMNNRRIPTS